jgi:hypothetical protein
MDPDFLKRSREGDQKEAPSLKRSREDDSSSGKKVKAGTDPMMARNRGKAGVSMDRGNSQRMLGKGAAATANFLRTQRGENKRNITPGARAWVPHNQYHTSIIKTTDMEIKWAQKKQEFLDMIRAQLGRVAAKAEKDEALKKTDLTSSLENLGEAVKLTQSWDEFEAAKRKEALTAAEAADASDDEADDEAAQRAQEVADATAAAADKARQQGLLLAINRAEAADLAFSTFSDGMDGAKGIKQRDEEEAMGSKHYLQVAVAGHQTFKEYLDELTIEFKNMSLSPSHLLI